MYKWCVCSGRCGSERAKCEGFLRKVEGVSVRVVMTSRTLTANCQRNTHPFKTQKGSKKNIKLKLRLCKNRTSWEEILLTQYSPKSCDPFKVWMTFLGECMNDLEEVEVEWNRVNYWEFWMFRPFIWMGWNSREKLNSSESLNGMNEKNTSLNVPNELNLLMFEWFESVEKCWSSWRTKKW